MVGLHYGAGPTGAGASATEPLRRFLQVARGAGLRISAAEGIDAARALDLVGYADRVILKDTLGLVLAKTPEEKRLYDETFELYFKRDELVAGSEDGDVHTQAASDANPSAQSTGGMAAGPGAGRALTDLLEADDRAGLAAAMESAARAVGLTDIRYFTQKNLYARRILDHMGLRELELTLEALHRADTPGEVGRAHMLEARAGRFRDAVRDFVERSMILFSRGETERFREELLRSVRLANLDRRDLDRMRVLVRQMARRLVTRYARTRRRNQRGQLDIRRTMRRNMGWGGVPFITTWKQRRIEKPKVMVLCDVSGSVAAMSQFLLMFLYALTETLAAIRSFAFSGSLIEVSEILEQEPVERAIERIMTLIGFGSSNYGNALADFEHDYMRHVDNKTTVIILGDARGNGNDPRTDILSRLGQRARRVIWLNPEFRSAWGTGDSDVYRYAPYCSLLRVCNTLTHLERVITDLLEASV